MFLAQIGHDPLATEFNGSWFQPSVYEILTFKIVTGTRLNEITIVLTPVNCAMNEALASGLVRLHHS